jgi:hypothetical protein
VIHNPHAFPERVLFRLLAIEDLDEREKEVQSLLRSRACATAFYAGQGGET